MEVIHSVARIVDTRRFSLSALPFNLVEPSPGSGFSPRRNSIASDITTVTGLSGDDDERSILKAVERAKIFRLCLRRIWAVSASLPERARSLPSLIPLVDDFSVPSHRLKHHEHEQCTFDFCEHSRIDFTSVAQRHECEDFKCGSYTFPLEQLKSRVDRASSTAWKLVSGSPDDVPSLLEPTKPYLAVSHVWADGTGAGIWGPGTVNRCLYEFFCKIAQDFQCEGCWWDAVSIPQDDETRSKALTVMHNNYADARITLVHDLYLRTWEWVDAATACFAIVMSPWYSRGWTALELAKSHKVKILFKTSNDSYVIKDLDIDILNQVPETSPYSPVAKSIGRLRNAKVHNLGDLLSTLVPRDTSKPRDVPIISGLLAGVDVSGALSQQAIYQRILRKLGKVAQGHLFHNSATMATPGFSWCPTNILDMPMASMEPSSVVLHIQENGDLEGKWNALRVNNIPDDNFIWHSAHDLTHVSLRLALSDGNRDQHIVLAENRSPKRALLVRPMKCKESAKGVIYCRFVGPVYFHVAPGSEKYKGQVDMLANITARISNNEKMKEVRGDSWDYVVKTTSQPEETTEGEPAPDDKQPGGSAWVSTAPDDEDAVSRHLEALLFIGEGVDREKWTSILTSEEARFPPVQSPPPEALASDMVMRYQHEDVQVDGSPARATVRAFFYGPKKLFGELIKWLDKDKEKKVAVDKMLLIHQDTNMEIKVDPKPGSAQKPSLGGQGLRLLAGHPGSGLGALVTLLLDNGAKYLEGDDGQWPIHLAIERGDVDVVRSMLMHEINPADPSKENSSRKKAIHLAAEKGRDDIVEILINGLKNKTEDGINARDVKGQTALIAASKLGYDLIAKLLLDNGANATIPEDTSLEQTALHYASMNGHDLFVSVLLKHAESEYDRQRVEGAAEGPSSSAPTKILDENEPLDDKEPEHQEAQDSSGPTASQATDVERKKAIAELAKLNLANRQRMTALHLAAQNGHSKVIKILVEYGAQRSATNQDGATALILAIQNHHKEAVTQFLSDWPTSEDHKGLEIALQSAAEILAKVPDKDSTIINALISKGAKSGYQKPSDGMTALHWAIKHKAVDIAQRLIADVENGDKRLDHKETKTGQSALIMSVECDLGEVTRALLGKGTAYTKSKDFTGRTVLHWAVVIHDADLVQTLLDMAGDGNNTFVDEQDNQERTALHLAAKEGQDVIISALLDKHANPSIPDTYGRSALMLAAAAGRENAVKKLLTTKSDPRTLDKYGKTALGLAAVKGHEPVVRAIFEAGNVKIKEDIAGDALRLAAQEGHLLVAMTIYNKTTKSASFQKTTIPAMLRSAATIARTSDSDIDSLMEIVVDPDAPNDEGQTALMLAVTNSKQSLFWRLLDRDVNLSLQDKRGRTALMVAVKKTKYDFVNALLDEGADPNIQDDQGYTALHHAAETGDYRLVDLLRGASPNMPIRMYRLKARQNKPDLDARDKRNRTALHIVMEKLPPRREGDAELSDGVDYQGLWQRWVRSGTTLTLQDAEGQTPLHRAVRRNQIEVVRMLMHTANIPDHGSRVSLDIPDEKKRTPLLLAAEREFWELVILLARRHGFRTDAQDDMGRTPLLIAAEKGHSHAVDVLLNQSKANPNIRDTKSRTPLLEAARNGHKEIVKILLRSKTQEADQDHEVDKKEKTSINVRDDVRRTALMLAAENGHERVVAYLLKENADSGLVDNEGKTAWQRAMDKGHTDVVKTLLSHHEMPNQDLTGLNNALLLASQSGWIKLVEVILSQDADVTFQNDAGSTALHLAATGGHVTVVKRLLDRGIDVITKDVKKRTALMLATEYGFESIVKLLLKPSKHSKKKLDIGDCMGPEALHCAAEKGNAGIVEQLLTTDVNVDSTDAARRTAMILAAANGSEKIIEMLLKKKAKATLKDKQGRTALHYAAWGGHENVVTSLLNRQDDADMLVNIPDDGKQTPLHLATERASIKVVELLLAKGANLNARSSDGQTALHRAAWGGSAEVVKLLRKKGADSSVQDQNSNKPWQVAAEKGHQIIVEVLLDAEERIGDKKVGQKKALIFAAQKGYTVMAEALLKKRADPTSKDQDPDAKGRTPLHWAAERGDYAMAELLITTVTSQDGITGKSLDIHDDLGRTPLCLAVLNDRAAVARLLIETGADPNTRDEKGLTLLHIAAKCGFGEIAQILGGYGADPHARDVHHRQKPWFLAALHGRHQIVRALLEREVDFNPQSQKVEELFFRVVEEGFVPMVRLLLDKKVNKDATDDVGQTALGLAAEREHADVVKCLLDAGADPSLQDSNLQTPLLWAAEKGSIRIMGLLLDSLPVKPRSRWGSPTRSSGTVTSSSSSEESADESANDSDDDSDDDGGFEHDSSDDDESRRGSRPPVGIRRFRSPGSSSSSGDNSDDGGDRPRLLRRSSTWMYRPRRDHRQPSPLVVRVPSLSPGDVRSPEFAERMLNHRGSQGQTALLLAIQGDEDEVVKLLLAKGPRRGLGLNGADLKGKTALHLVAEKGKENLVTELLKDAADQTLRDKLGRTPLFLAVQHGHEKVVNALLPSRYHFTMDLDLADEHKRTPLHVAAERGHAAIVKRLLERGAETNVQDHLERTPLLLAAENGEAKVAELLLEDGAQQGIPDGNGRTPLLVAVTNGDFAIAKRLFEHRGYDVSIRGRKGQSLLHLALNSGSQQVAWLVANQLQKAKSPFGFSGLVTAESLPEP